MNITMQKCHSIIVTGKDNVIDNFTHAIKVRGKESGAEIEDIKEQLLPFIDLPDEFSKVSSDDEFDLGRKLDKGNLLLATMIIDNKTGFNNLNTNLNTGFNNLNTDLNTGFNNLTTMMFEHNTRLEAILEKLANR